MEPLRFVIDSRLEAVAELGSRVSAACAGIGIDEEALCDIELAVVEAATNVVCHGYRGLPVGAVEVEVRLQPDQVQVDIIDRGAPIPEGLLDQAEIAEPGDIAALADSGRGLALIRASVDSWAYETSPAGNRLKLVKRRSI